MFIGHYAVAPLAAATGKVKLWQAFIAVQFADFIWAILILTGIEKGRVVDGFMEGSALDLHYMPYSHSLLFITFWACIAAGLFWLYNERRNYGGAIIIAILVLSHWFGDVLVHGPDMTVLPGSEKIGMGSWDEVESSLSLEIGSLVCALMIYTRLTVPASGKSFLYAILFCAFLVGLQLYSTFGPVPADINTVAISALVAYSVIALAAYGLECSRDLYYEAVADIHERI